MIIYELDDKIRKTHTHLSKGWIKNIDLLLAVTHKFPQDLDVFYMFFWHNFPPQVIP